MKPPTNLFLRQSRTQSPLCKTSPYVPSAELNSLFVVIVTQKRPLSFPPKKKIKEKRKTPQSPKIYCDWIPAELQCRQGICTGNYYGWHVCLGFEDSVFMCFSFLHQLSSLLSACLFPISFTVAIFALSKELSRALTLSWALCTLEVRLANLEPNFGSFLALFIPFFPTTVFYLPLPRHSPLHLAMLPEQYPAASTCGWRQLGCSWLLRCRAPHGHCVSHSSPLWSISSFPATWFSGKRDSLSLCVITHCSTTRVPCGSRHHMLL